MVDSSRPIMTSGRCGVTIARGLDLLPLALSIQHVKHAIPITQVMVGKAMEKQTILKIRRPVDNWPEI